MNWLIWLKFVIAFCLDATNTSLVFREND